MPWSGHERRRHGGMNDEQISELAERVTFLLEQEEDGLCDRIGKRLESRVFEWVGRKAAQFLLLLVGAALTGAWLFIQYLKAQGVI
jgi:hypothetical protein